MGLTAVVFSAWKLVSFFDLECVVHSPPSTVLASNVVYPSTVQPTGRLIPARVHHQHWSHASSSSPSTPHILVPFLILEPRPNQI
jgi:hypothetical protein